MTSGQFAAGFTVWAIVATGAGYESREVPVAGVGAANILAVHPNKSSAEGGLKRVRIFTHLLHPEWAGDAAYQPGFVDMIARVTREVAMPRPEADAPPMAL